MRTYIRRPFDAPFVGDRVKIDVNIGWDFVLSTNGDPAGIMFGRNQEGARPLGIYFSGRDGIYVKGGAASEPIHSLLGRNEAKSGYIYQFTVYLDQVTRSFDVEMTGENASSETVFKKLEGISYDSLTGRSHEIEQIFVQTLRGDRERVLLQSISMTPIPEGGSVMLFLGGIALLPWMGMLSKRKI